MKLAGLIQSRYTISMRCEMPQPSGGNEQKDDIFQLDQTFLPPSRAKLHVR